MDFVGNINLEILINILILRTGIKLTFIFFVYYQKHQCVNNSIVLIMKLWWVGVCTRFLWYFIEFFRHTKKKYQKYFIR